MRTREGPGTGRKLGMRGSVGRREVGDEDGEGWDEGSEESV